jgi:hypothetical protein
METKMKKLLAYHNKASVKSKYVRRVEAHRKADELVQGTGWESNGHVRGCAVGCTFDCYDHKRGPIEIGVPEILMRLEDVIYESLPKADALLWPTRFLKAIPVGADLSLVHHRWFVWLLSESGLLTITDLNREAIANVAELHKRAAAGETVACNEWSAAESAARSAESAAWSAAWSAARSAESAAWSAAWSAAESAESAAWSAAESAAESAARSAARSATLVKSWKLIADNLIRLLEESK